MLWTTAMATAMTPNQHHEPFATLQPGVGPITLTYQGDDFFNWYEDAAGFTVVHQRGRYYYAELSDAGNLVATSYLVGLVDPATVGLNAGTLPTAPHMNAIRTAAMNSGASFEPPAQVTIPDNCTLIDGCIVVPNSMLPSNDGDGSQPQFGTHITVGTWPDGIVPYTFDGTVNSTNQQRMRDAMDAWEVIANVQFVPRSAETHYIEVISSSGNWSYVGRIGGKQQLSIYNWTYQFIIMHELAHALGVWHEQSRPDRDTYVQIESGNIQSGKENNFDIQTGAGTTGNYDFDSIMHYGQCAFSNCACSASCRTITVQSPNESWQTQIGQRSHLSVGDAANMETMYGAAVADDSAEMTQPVSNGDLINDDTFTFEWDSGTGVTQYEFLVGSTAGDNDIDSYLGTATQRLVAGLPTDGSTIFVALKSQIGGTWFTRSYAYSHGVDTCPGFSDLEDVDADGVPDGCDVCPGEDDEYDSDGDETPDCLDGCPSDGNKVEPGDCGCGEIDTDSDNDGVADCADACPNNSTKTTAGICGCDNEDTDSDQDGTPDCNDDCPLDPDKISPGICGCGARVRDFDGDGDFECDDGSNVPIDPTTGDVDRGIEPPTVSVSVCGMTGSTLMLTMALLAVPMWSRKRRRM